MKKSGSKRRTVYKSAVSGRFVTKKYAKSHGHTTFVEKVKFGGKARKKRT